MSAPAQSRPSWRARVDLTRERAQAVSDRMRADVPALDLVWDLYQRYRSHNGTVLTGHIAYRLFLWLAPLLLVLTGILGLSVTQDIDLVQYASNVGVADDVAADVAGQARTRGLTSLIVGLVTLVIATWSLVRGIHLVYSQVWDLELRSRKRMARSVALTIAASLVAVGIHAVIAALERRGLLLALGGWVISVAATTFGLWLVCWSLPRRTSRWLDLVPGAAVAAAGFSVVNVFAAVYLPARIQSASQLYGAIGIVFAVLFYLFLVAFLVVGMAFVNSVWVDREQVLEGRNLFIRRFW